MMEKRMSTGQLARLASVSPDTIRHYEREGLLPKAWRGENGYRCYPPSSIARVQLVRRALRVGFTIKELAGILRIRESGGTPCQKVREIAAQKLSEIQDRLSELTALRNELRSILRFWDSQLATTPAGKRAHLLESLSMVEPVGRAAPFTSKSKRTKKKGKYETA
jgi:DNA-binding transcriptional MerR regulator